MAQPVPAPNCLEQPCVSLAIDGVGARTQLCEVSSVDSVDPLA